MKGMTEIVKTITRFVGSTILLYGAYILLHGHSLHGGGFAGGIIFAASFILLTLAYGKEVTRKILNLENAIAIISVGALAFLCIGILGMISGSFFENFLPKTGPIELLTAGTIPYANLAVGFMIFAAVFTIFIYLAVFRINRSGGK